MLGSHLSSLDCSNLYAVTYPSLANLFIMKWKDEEGKLHRLKIFQELGKHWKDIGILVGLTWQELEKIEASSGGEEIRLSQLVFKDWLSGKHIENYPNTWAGLHELLQDVELVELAEKMRVALANKDIVI